MQALVALLPLQLREDLGLLGTRSEDHKSVEKKTRLMEWRESYFQTYTAFINEFTLVTHTVTSNQSQQE